MGSNQALERLAEHLGGLLSPEQFSVVISHCSPESEPHIQLHLRKRVVFAKC